MPPTNEQQDETLSPLAFRLLYTESDTAKLLSICPRSLYTLRGSGAIAASKIGSRVLYHIDEIRRFAAESVGKTISI